MKSRYEMDDPEFDAMWRAFAADEARVQAPGRLGPAVMAAWDGAHAQPSWARPLRRRRVPVAVLLAAAALVLAVGLAVRYGGERDIESEGGSEAAAIGQVTMPVVPARAPVATLVTTLPTTLPTTPAAAPAVAPDTDPGALEDTSAQPVRRLDRATVPAAVASAVASVADAGRIGAGAIVTLAADRAFETEVLQIMRVRVPRESLQVFGVPLPGPEASGLVDVDVLVGADGLARDIRRIRSVVDTGAQGYNR